MGHTLSTALRKSDQLALDTLLDEANQHLPAAGYAANLLPGIGFLLALLLEKHKQVIHLESVLEDQDKDFKRQREDDRKEFAAELGKLRIELFLLKGQINGH
jgi:hypothetical protein